MLIIIDLLRIALSYENEIFTQVAPVDGVSFGMRNIVIYALVSL